MPITVQVPPNVHPRQIDDFGPDVERSKTGALYFVPGAVKHLTPGEYEHLKKKHKRFAELLIVVAHPKPKPKAKDSAESEAVAKPKSPKDKVSQAKLRQAEILKKKSENQQPQVTPKVEPETPDILINHPPIPPLVDDLPVTDVEEASVEVVEATPVEQVFENISKKKKKKRK